MPLPFRVTLALCLPALLGVGAPAFAATRRVAVVVGNNVGGPTDKPLRFAEEDSGKVADVLAQLGDVHPDDLLVLKGKTRSELEQVMAAAAGRIASYHQAPEDRTLLLFYYSGHSDGEALELGTSRVTYTELRAWIARTRADVRVAILDSCRSGSLVQSKGGRRAAPFEIKLSDQLDATGEVMLTSSAADELALESREIRGSLFTHHFVSGLRGAADASGDGRVTLAEAYQYAFDHTLASSAETGVRQHPGYEYRLAGQGELVLTELSEPSASLELPEGFERGLVLLVRRDQVVAELDAGGARRVALAPGEYAVRLWKGSQAYAARMTIAEGEARRVSWSELRTAPAAPVAAKGSPAMAVAPEALEDLTPEARVEYLDKALTVTDGPGMVGWGLGQGRYQKPLRVQDFYRTVGREDLARSWERRATTGLALMGAGLAVELAGLGVGLANARNGRGTKIILVGVAVGGVLQLAGSAALPRAPERHELRRMAEEYNDALHRRLEEPSGASRDGPTLQLGAAVVPGGGGLALSGTF